MIPVQSSLFPLIQNTTFSAGLKRRFSVEQVSAGADRQDLMYFTFRYKVGSLGVDACIKRRRFGIGKEDGLL